MKLPEGKKIKLVNREEYLIVSNRDYDEILKYRWYLGQEGYPQCTSRKLFGLKPVRLHQFLMGKKDGMYVDHINRNKLDNRRENLRFVTPLESVGNMSIPSHNTSGYKGVSASKTKGKWRAYIKHNRKQKSLGHYFTKEEAALAYNKAALEYFGSFANLNEVYNG